jgi:uncharacterized membrane protein (UPF0182 family)
MDHRVAVEVVNELDDSDPPDYGKLIVYEFPKDKLVYGPFQIEAERVAAIALNWRR